MIAEPEFLNVLEAQESIPPAYVTWRAGTSNTLLKPDEAEHYATLAWSR